MSETVDAATVRCSCCGQDRTSEGVARLSCHPEIAVCGACVHYLAGQVEHRPAVTPIFPVKDMDAAREFWTRAGLEVHAYDAGYAFVMFGGSEVVHLSLHPDLDPERNAAACYVHVDDPRGWQQRWKVQGLPVSDVKVEPWGMLEFSVRDPSGNLLRMGRNA
ncbi:MAG: bleomycin resistance protein [Dehalococcoidia bacterium]